MAFLMLICITGLVFWLKAKKRLRTFLIACVAAVIFFVVVIKVDVLYNILGYRLVEMIKGFLGEGGDNSFDVRANMIKLGWNWFLDKPILGYGLRNFTVLYQEITGWETYSHNNFIEILVGLGLTGFVVYYSIYIYLFVKLFKKCFIERDLLAIILFSVNASMFLMQVAIVSFYSTLPNCVLMLGMAYFNIREKKNENS